MSHIGEVNLWKAVALQAYKDASLIRDNRIKENQMASEYIYRKAQVWVGTRDFHEVCIMAGIEARRFEAKMLEARVERDDTEPKGCDGHHGIRKAKSPFKIGAVWEQTINQG